MVEFLTMKWKQIVGVVVLATLCSAQQKKSCDENLNFCWYDDEVTVQGNRWVSEDHKDTLEVGLTFRCVKPLNLCIRARSYHNLTDNNLIVTNIELMPITHWDSQQVATKAENYDSEPCGRDSYVINRSDRTVLLISSPGPQSDTPACTGIHGKPRTVTYRLSH